MQYMTDGFAGCWWKVGASIDPTKIILIIEYLQFHVPIPWKKKTVQVYQWSCMKCLLLLLLWKRRFQMRVPVLWHCAWSSAWLIHFLQFNSRKNNKEKHRRREEIVVMWRNECKLMNVRRKNQERIRYLYFNLIKESILISFFFNKKKHQWKPGVELLCFLSFAFIAIVSPLNAQFGLEMDGTLFQRLQSVVVNVSHSWRMCPQQIGQKNIIE